MKNNEVDYNDLTDEAREVYLGIIEKYLKVSPVRLSAITPEVAKIMDDFILSLHNCTKRLKIFVSIFGKASTVFGLVKAVGKEVAKEELTKAFQKSISLVCYTSSFRAYGLAVYKLVM